MNIDNQISTKNILYVEDCKDLIKLYFKMLMKTNSNYKCFIAHSQSEAISIYKQNTIDLLITDITINDGSGIELIKQIRNEYQNTSMGIVIASAHDPDKIYKHINEDYIFHYLLKPYNIDDLKEIVNKYFLN